MTDAQKPQEPPASSGGLTITLSARTAQGLLWGLLGIGAGGATATGLTSWAGPDEAKVRAIVQEELKAARQGEGPLADLATTSDLAELEEDLAASVKTAVLELELRAVNGNGAGAVGNGG